MTTVRGIRAGGALALLLLVPQLAPAAWDNVFQVTCFGCRKNTTAAYAPPSCASCAPPCPCAAPCPCQTTTAYVQRTYYQPVTTFQAETHFEPVTSTRTSYFWEPVTSYTYSSFFDHCSCSCQQVATPVTSFRLRSQCNSVVSYVARVSYRPVTTFRQSCYMEAVQVPSCPAPCPTCPTAAAPPCPTCPQTGAPIAPAQAIAPATIPPLNATQEPPAAGLNEQRAPSQPGLSEQRDFYPPIPPATGQSLHPTTAPVTPVPAYKPERVASRRVDGSTVNGQVVRNDFAPRAGAQVVFVNAARQNVRTTADATGRFQVNLGSGDWFVYVGDNAGGLAYHNQLTVRSGDTAPVTVVSR